MPFMNEPQKTSALLLLNLEGTDLGETENKCGCCV